MSFGDLKVQDLIYEDSSNNEITVVIADLATKANPTFTGTVTVPTAPASDVSTKAASTAFVDAYYATKASPTFTGTPTVPGYAQLAGAAFTGAVTGTDLTLSGNLVVNGTTTTINTQTLDVEDKNISLGKVSNPSDTTADGGGITLLGSSNKTFNWVNATDAWTSSEHIYLGDNKKLLLGVGAGGVQDLSVYSNGSEGILETQSGGTIKLKCATGSSSTDTFATFSGAASQIDFHKSVLFIGNTKNIVWDNPNDSLYFTDNAKIRLGAGSGVAGDLLLYSDGTVGIIQAPSGQGIHIGNAGTEAIIDVEPTQVVFNKNISSQDNDIDIRKSGASKLLWDDSDTAFEFANDVKLTFGGSAGSSGQVLTSGGSGAAPSWTSISAAPEATGTISGTLPDGKAVIVNSDGTLSEAGLDGPNYSSTGTDVVTDTYLGEVCSAPMRGNRIIVVWNSNGTSNYGGKACIGSINPSNRTISFGSVATVPSSGDYDNFQYPDVYVYDHSNYGEMAIVSWWHESDGGPKWNILTCPAGDTSTSAPTWTTQGASGYGNSKFGRSMTKLNNRLIITFNSGNNAYIKALEVGNQQFQSAGSSYNYGTYVKTAKIASATSGAGLIVYDRAAQEELNLRPFTSSSNTISLQTNQEETSENNITIDSTWATPNYNFIGITKFPLISGSNYIYGIQFRKTSGSASVIRAGLVSVTASGSGVSQSTRVTVATNTILNGGFYNDPTFDTDGNLVCHWSDGTSSSASKTAYASLSGSGAASSWTIGSFSTPASISTSSLAGQTTVQLSMSNGTGAIVVTYNDGADNNYGKSFVRTGIVTNVTTDNYLGYSDGAFTNGQTGKVKVVGNIVTGLSGLTAGSKMYLQNNGTLSTTAASPSVVAGLALSSTKLLIKG